MIVGIGGRKRSGKDEVAAVLERRYGFGRFAFSDALIDVCHILFGTPTREERAARPDLGTALFRLPAGPRGGSCPMMSARAIWQWFGTEVMRARWPDIWILALRRGIAGAFWMTPREISRSTSHHVVVTGVRFENEAAWIKSVGGLLWRVDRPGLPDDAHASEHGLSDWTDWDEVIQNDGTLSELEALVVKGFVAGLRMARSRPESAAIPEGQAGQGPEDV